MARRRTLLPEGVGLLRHGLGFLAGGATAFGVDALVLELLTVGLGVTPILARLAAISLAMVAGWLMHRTYTFAVGSPPSFSEFVRYAGVAWSAAAINYGSFVVIVLVLPWVDPLAGMVASSLLAMVFSYLGMRVAAFRRRFAHQEK